MVSKNGFDLRHNMGTLLAEDKSKFQFSSPSQIRTASISAFGRTSVIKRMWSEIFQDLELLNLVGNLIAHRAGLVDQRFNSKTQLNLPVGKPLPLKSTNVIRLIDIAALAGCELLTTVNKWFADHPS